MRTDAAEVFGGESQIQNRLQGAILAAMRAQELDASQLAEMASLEDEDLERWQKSLQDPSALDGEIALAVMAQLGLSARDILDDPGLTEEETDYWIGRMRSAKAGPVFFTGGMPCDGSQINPLAMVLVFIRFAAVRGLGRV